MFGFGWPSMLLEPRTCFDLPQRVFELVVFYEFGFRSFDMSSTKMQSRSCQELGGNLVPDVWGLGPEISTCL